MKKKKNLYKDYYPFNMMDGCLNEKQILYMDLWLMQVGIGGVIVTLLF